MEIRFDSGVELKNLERVIETVEESKRLHKVLKKIKLNFSETRYFSARSLILLIVLIDFLEKQGISVKMVLPTPRKDEDPDDAQKTRDFLKRWKFFDTLKVCFGDDASFLEYDQLDYLFQDPKYYLRTTRRDEKGRLYELYSTKVIEISHFIEKEKESTSTSQAQVERILSDYTEERITHILATGIKWRQKNPKITARDFVIKCIREPLMNALDHAEAGIGLVTSQVDEKYFNISIIDNGRGIPTTIEPVYKYYREARKEMKKTSDTELIRYAFELPIEEDIQLILDEIDRREEVTEKRDARLIKFAHLKGVTSKPETHKGLGLFLLKEFVGETRGFFDVRSCKGYVRFEFDNQRKKIIPRVEEERSFWPGTFISIYLPHRIELKNGKN